MIEIKQVGVVGAGLMGSGIAQVAAQAGFLVRVTDSDKGSIARAQGRIDASLQKLCDKNVLTKQDVEDSRARIKWSQELSAQSASDLLIEAVPESESLKISIWRNLDEIIPKHSIMASNTSSISITRLAATTSRPDRFIGMHFMNPVPLMKLVEVIKGIQTSEETYHTTIFLAEKMGKTTTTSSDSPGFISNRILMPLVNEAFFALMENVASKEDIDKTIKLGANHPMGPLSLADFVGLDTCLYIMEVLHRGLGDDKYRPCPLLRQYVDAGFLGRKTGRGIFVY